MPTAGATATGTYVFDADVEDVLPADPVQGDYPLSFRCAFVAWGTGNLRMGNDPGIPVGSSILVQANPDPDTKRSRRRS